MSQPDLSRLKIDRSPQANTASANALHHRPRRWRRWQTWAWVGAGLLVVLGSVLAARSGAVTVEVATVSTAYPYQAVSLLNASGYVVAQRKASVASKATGRLEWLGVVEGSQVKQGEVIARLESRDVRATAEQAEANIAVAKANVGQSEAELRDAEANYRRTQELVQKQFVSAANLDAARARLDRAKANVQSSKAAVLAAQANARAAEVNAEHTVIRAPFDGVVLTKNANVGDTITPFSSALDTKGAVVTLADMSTLEVEADVSEANLGKIKLGQPCEIQLDAFPEQRFRGEVSRIVPTVDRAKASVMTKVRFLERDASLGARILPEMSAKVAFLTQAMPDNARQPLTVLNPKTVVEQSGTASVFIVQAVQGEADKLQAVRQNVQLGEMLGDNRIVMGLKAGTKLVLNPPANLRDGAALKLQQK